MLSAASRQREAPVLPCPFHAVGVPLSPAHPLPRGLLHTSTDYWVPQKTAPFHRCGTACGHFRGRGGRTAGDERRATVESLFRSTADAGDGGHVAGVVRGGCPAHCR